MWAAGTASYRAESYAEAREFYVEAQKDLRGTALAAYPAFGAWLCRWALGDPRDEELVTLVRSAPPALQPRIYYVQAVRARQQGEFVTALTGLQQLIANVPRSDTLWVEAQVEQILCLAQLGQLDDARRLWSQLAAQPLEVDSHTYVVTALEGLALGAAGPVLLRGSERLPEGHVQAIMTWQWSQQHGVDGRRV
jgi:tetratricopeptide (TPR) repeat protein